MTRLGDSPGLPSERELHLLRWIEWITIENWQLKGALGYEVFFYVRPGNFQCGVCAARSNEKEPQ